MRAAAAAWGDSKQHRGAAGKSKGELILESMVHLPDQGWR